MIEHCDILPTEACEISLGDTQNLAGYDFCCWGSFEGRPALSKCLDYLACSSPILLKYFCDGAGFEPRNPWMLLVLRSGVWNTYTPVNDTETTTLVLLHDSAVFMIKNVETQQKPWSSGHRVTAEPGGGANEAATFWDITTQGRPYPLGSGAVSTHSRAAHTVSGAWKN